MKKNLIFFLFGLVILTLFGCGGGGSSDTVPPSIGSVTLSADAVSGTTTVGTVVSLTADVKTDSGVAAEDGTVVTFSADQGTLSAVTATTINGKATTTITSSVYTSSTITATVDGKSSTTRILFDDPSLPATISLANSLSQSIVGGNVSIIADVKNGTGAPVADGTTVNFVTTGGILSAQTATTIGGRATVNLLSNDPATLTVTGSVSSVKETITGSAVVAFVPVSITLSSDAAGNTANVGTSVTLTASVTFTGGIPVPDGTTVTFAASTGTLSAVFATTTNGKATVTISSNAYGQSTVTATAAGITSAPTVILFNDPRLPATVNLSSTLLQSPIGVPVTVSAVVKNGTGAPVADGTTVNFVTTGGILSAQSATTSGGVASVTLTSNALGTIKVTGSVTTQAGTPQGTVDVSFVPVTLNLTADAVGTVTKGTVVTLTADVSLPGGVAAPDGMVVSFSLSDNNATLSATSATTTGGKALVYLTGTAYGGVTVTCTTAGVSAQATVMFDDPTLPATINLTHTPAQGIVGNPAGVVISATVRDGYGALVPDGTTVNFSTSGGALSPSSATTSGGVVTALLTSSALGTITVTGSVTSVKGTIVGTDNISFVKDPSLPNSLTLSTSPASPIFADTVPYTITANVLNGASTAVADGTVINFTVSGGGTLSTTSVGTVGGKATVTLSSAVAGNQTVTATVASDTTITATTPTLLFVVRPTKALVKLSTSGTLPQTTPATYVGGWQITMNIPASVSILNASGQIDATALYASGQAAAGSYAFGNYIAGPPQSISAALINPNGFGIGETATFEFTMASSGPLPVQSDFWIAPGYSLTDQTGNVDLTAFGVTLGISSLTFQ